MQIPGLRRWRRRTGSGSALAVLRDDVIHKYTFTLLAPLAKQTRRLPGEHTDKHHSARGGWV